MLIVQGAPQASGSLGVHIFVPLTSLFPALATHGIGRQMFSITAALNASERDNLTRRPTQAWSYTASFMCIFLLFLLSYTVFETIVVVVLLFFTIF